jgi:hypothetical protein
MNIEKMSELIMKHPEFLDCCEKRLDTSSTNKLLHQAVIDCINAGDTEGVKTMLSYPFYNRPLKGIIFCMDTHHEVIDEFYQAFNEPVCTYEEYFSLKKQVETLTRERDEGGLLR